MAYELWIFSQETLIHFSNKEEGSNFSHKNWGVGKLGGGGEVLKRGYITYFQTLSNVIKVVGCCEHIAGVVNIYLCGCVLISPLTPACVAGLCVCDTKLEY